MEFKDMISSFFTIFIPVIIGLTAFAYKAPKAYSAVHHDIVKYVFWTWWLMVFVIMTFWLLEKFELIKVFFFSDDFREFSDNVSGPDLLIIIFIPPVLVWFLFRLIGLVSKYRELK